MRGPSNCYLLTFVLLAATALAGCSDDPPEDPGDDVGQVAATSTTGGIRGVVVDEAIRPLADVTVAVDAIQASAVTTEDGAFLFEGIAPGEYVVRASHPLYATTQQIATVEAGVRDPPVLRFVLQRTVFSEPYMQTIKEQGYITCSANIVGAKSEECGEGVGVPGLGRVGGNENNRAQIDFYVDGPAVQTIIVEQVWEPSTEVGAGEEPGQFDTRVALDWSCDPVCGGNMLASAVGGSPLYMRIDAERLAEENITAETVFSTFTWAEDNPGVLVEQEFEVFISAFYVLPAPEGWSFVNGDPPPF